MLRIEMTAETAAQARKEMLDLLGLDEADAGTAEFGVAKIGDGTLLKLILEFIKPLIPILLPIFLKTPEGKAIVMKLMGAGEPVDATPDGE